MFDFVTNAIPVAVIANDKIVSIFVHEDSAVGRYYHYGSTSKEERMERECGYFWNRTSCCCSK
jgi:hypothetical protein